jgi:hypothetical protein
MGPNLMTAADDLYKAEARNLQAGMKDFAKALNKAKRH